MAYAWQRVPAHQSFEAARKLPISFDSWILAVYDDHARPSAEQPKTVAWFADPEEAVQFMDERLLALWFAPEETAQRDAAAAILSKLKAARKLKLKDLEAWKNGFNAISGARST